MNASFLRRKREVGTGTEIEQSSFDQSEGAIPKAEMPSNCSSTSSANVSHNIP